MSDVDPGRVSARLRAAGDGLADVRYAVESAAETASHPLRVTEHSVTEGQLKVARLGNLGQDAAAGAGESSRALETLCADVATLALTVDDAQLHAAQLVRLIDRSRGTWEGELATRRRDVADLQARLTRAKGGEEGGLRARIEALEGRIRCAEDALAHCRRASGIAARAQLAARRADDELQSALVGVEQVEQGLGQAGRLLQSAASRTDSARQAILGAADHVSFAKRAHRSIGEAVRAMLGHARRAEHGLDDAAEQLRLLDRGTPR